MDYTFDTEATAYAYVTAETSCYGDRFGHLNLHLRLPTLARAWNMDAVQIEVTSQCSERERVETEPLYAIRMTVKSFGSEGLNLKNLERAAKVMRALEKAIAKIDAAAGAPATLFEDYMMRVLKAARVEYVYCPESAMDRDGRYSIPDLPRYAGADFERLHSQLRHLKRALVSYVNREASTA